MYRVTWGPEDTEARGIGQGFLEQLQIFGPQLETRVRPPSDVSSGARKAGDDSAPNRISSKPNDDRYRRSGLLGSQGRRRGRVDDEVHLEADKFSRERCKLFGFPLGE